MTKKWIPYMIAAAGAGAAVAIAFGGKGSASTVTTVPDVDLERYAGKWFEIARFPNRFQRQCEEDVSATYQVLPHGKIAVRNECRTSDGRSKRIAGTARRASSEGPNSKLKVTFFWPFRGDYWIVDLDPAYRWAIVGDPYRKYLWFLSREPRVSEEQYRDLAARAGRQGFDTGRLMRTKQGG